MLKSLKDRKTNQMIIIMNLSIVDILLALIWFSNAILSIADPSLANNDRTDGISWRVRAGVYLTWYATIFLITFDRFLGCNFPIKHKVFIRTKVIYMCLATSWTITMLFVVITCLINTESLQHHFDLYIWVTIDSCFVILFIATYASIFLYLKRKRGAGSTTNNDVDKFMYTVAALTMAFFCFEIVPTLLKPFHMKGSATYEEVRSILYTMNLLFDPVLYVFLQPQVRKHAFALFHRMHLRLKSTCVRSSEDEEYPVADL